MEYSQLEQERRKRGWSRAHVEEISGIPQPTLFDAEKGKHEPNRGTRKELCRLYGKNEKELGLVKGGDIMMVGHTNAPTSQGETPMSDLIRRAVFSNLSSKLTGLIDLWPKRNYHYEELQNEINRAVIASHIQADTISEVSRREALKSVGLVPIQLCVGLDGIINLHKAQADTDTLLKHLAAGITVCWYLRRGKELVFTNDLISTYINLLQPLVYSKSDVYRKASATLLAQCLTFKSKLASALRDDDQAIAYEEEAIRYASIAESITEQAIANREMALLYWRRKKYKQALPYAATAYGLAKSNKATPKIILSFTASGLSFCQASSGYLEDAQISLKEAHDLFDPTMLIPSMPYGEATLADIDACIYRHMGNFKAAIDIFKQYRDFPITVLGDIQNNIEYAETEVNRDDQPRDMALCITLLTQGITSATELDSKWYIREAHAVYDLLRAAWPREDAIKKLGKDHFGK